MKQPLQWKDPHEQNLPTTYPLLHGSYVPIDMICHRQWKHKLSVIFDECHENVFQLI